MTENGIRPRGENSAKTFAVNRETPIPNRKHPPMETVKAAISYRPINGLARVAQRPHQLTNRNNSVLAVRQIRKSPMLPKVRRTFAPHSDPKGPADLVSPPAGGLEGRYEHEKSRRP